MIRALLTWVVVALLGGASIVMFVSAVDDPPPVHASVLSAIVRSSAPPATIGRSSGKVACAGEALLSDGTVAEIVWAEAGDTCHELAEVKPR
jgi:hypothetical protein